MQEISGKVAVIGVGYSKITRSPQQSMARDRPARTPSLTQA